MKISHEEVREIAKNKLHWSGGRVEVLQYCAVQEKVEELLELYREVWKDDIENNLPAEQYIELVNKLIKAEEELKGSESK